MRGFKAACAIFGTLTGVGLAAPEGGAVRAPAVAGTFYERAPFALAAQVDGLLRTARSVPAAGSLMAAVVPHAGFMFSGRCAASVYALVHTGQYDRVILMAPSHRARVEGISLPDPALVAYRTPLGDVPIDRALCASLRQQQGFTWVPGADGPEHAIEVQLPFLQRRAGAFRLVPLLCGRIGEDEVARLAAALAPHLGPRTLLLASSDFTHYGPNYGFVPFVDDVAGQLHRWLDAAAAQVAALDQAGFARHCRTRQDTICGALPIRILMAALAQSGLPVRGQVLDRTTSGDVVGSFDNSVSYAAIGFFTPAQTSPEGERSATMSKTESPAAGSAFSVSAASQTQLLALARQAIEGALRTNQAPTAAVTAPELLTPAAVFVTLTQQGQLRGCIGTLEARQPLYQAVRDYAVAAAVQDRRFSPLTLDELSRTHIEISVLSPMVRVKSAEAIQPHVHGVVVRRGGRSGLFLPQVWEHFSSKEAFLGELCRQKAHLEPEAWKDPQTELQVFTVFAFEDPR